MEAGYYILNMAIPLLGGLGEYKPVDSIEQATKLAVSEQWQHGSLIRVDDNQRVLDRWYWKTGEEPAWVKID